MLHIVGRPPLVFSPCVHKRTRQEYTFAPSDGTCETVHGTMSFRRGDAIVIGANGSVYVLTRESFEAAYDKGGLSG